MPSKEWLETNQDRMRTYRREWYYRNRESSQLRAAANRKRTKEAAFEYVNQIKAGLCMDCDGQFHPWAMHFDHLGDKTAEVSRMIGNGRPLELIKQEIEKCELVCANCHAVRTYTRWAADQLPTAERP